MPFDIGRHLIRIAAGKGPQLRGRHGEGSRLK